MKAIVCVKQVPDTSGVVAVKADGTMDRAAMATITNHDDLAAVEAALDLKDQTGCEVIVVSMGPPPAEGMLRELIAMGADRAVLISAREFGGSDTYATSQIIAAAVQKIGVADDDEKGGELPHEVHPRHSGIEGRDARDGRQHKQVVVQIAVCCLAHVQPDVQRIAQGKGERQRRQPHTRPSPALGERLIPKGNQQEHGAGNQLQGKTAEAAQVQSD